MIPRRLNYKQFPRNGALFCDQDESAWPKPKSFPYCDTVLPEITWPLHNFCDHDSLTDFPIFNELQIQLDVALTEGLSAHLKKANVNVPTWPGSPNNATANSGIVNLGLLNEFPSVDFSANGRMQLATNIFGPGRTIRTDFIVASALNLGTQPRHLYGQGSASQGFVNTYGHGFFYNGSVLGYKANNNSATVGVLLSSYNPSNNIFIAAYVSNGSSTQLWINGQMVNQGPAAPNPWNYSTTFISRTPSSGNEFWNGTVGEIISFASPKTTFEVDLIFGYIAHSWNLTSLLPSNHPYKSEFI